MPAYEISNHARPGGECRHNLIYWRYGDYAGIGPGAHGRLTLDGTRLATSTERVPERWLARVDQHGHGELPREPIEPAQQLTELLMMGLRLREGVPLARIESAAGPSIRATIEDRAHRLARGGFVQVTADRLVATETGRQRLDALLVELIP